MTRGRWARAAASLTLALALAGCGGTNTTFSAIAPAAPIVRDLANYDAFVLASAENNPMFADVYAITFAPFTIHRITSDKRISALGADENHVVVAAADEQVDKLALVTGTGDVTPIPGLGRPFAYAPSIRNGIMYFVDAQGEDATGGDRYFSWDLRKQAKKLLFRTNQQLGGALPTFDGRLLFDKTDAQDEDGVVLRARSGKFRTLPFGDRGGNAQPGRD